MIGVLKIEKENLEIEINRLQNESARASVTWTENSDDFQESGRNFQSEDERKEQRATGESSFGLEESTRLQVCWNVLRTAVSLPFLEIACFFNESWTDSINRLSLSFLSIFW